MKTFRIQLDASTLVSYTVEVTAKDMKEAKIFAIKKTLNSNSRDWEVLYVPESSDIIINNCEEIK